jgi:hypothetical protein
MKPVYALYLGAVLVLAGVAGGVSTLLGEASKGGQDKRRKVARPAPTKQPMAVVKDTLTEEEKAAETTRVLLAQVSQTPDRIDAAWLASFCRYISDAASLEAYIAPLNALGQQRNVAYQRLRQAAKKLPHGDPRYFIGQARAAIFDRHASLEILHGKASPMLALSLYREYDAVRQEHVKERERLVRSGKMPKAQASSDSGDALRFLDLDDDFAFSFLKEKIALQRGVLQLSRKAGVSTDKAEADLVKAYEAIVVDRFLRIDERHQTARQRLKASGASAKPVLRRTGNWKKALEQYLLALGQDYVEVAAGETTFKRRQEAAAGRAAQALSMVYQMTHSGAALAGLRRINEIQRYNLWQMARANWRAAKAAATRGEIAAADQSYFTANRHYLQCLARLEVFTQEKVRREYRRFKSDVAAWHAERAKVTATSAMASAVADGQG